MQVPQLFTYGDFTLEYLVYGHGKKQLLYFHGYGKHASEFADYRMPLDDVYTVYSFSFFHHGHSKYPQHRIDQNTLTAKELTEIVTAFLRSKNIERFSLMGYSMGGKICLSLLQDLYLQVDKLVLVAPDGIKKNFWYRFTSNNRLGNALYRKIIHRPRPFFFFMRLLRGTHLLHQRLYEFVRLHLETDEQRRHVYNVWMTLRNISPDSRQAARIIQQHQIPASLHYGRFDRVITLRQGQRFKALAGGYAQLHVLDKGHKMANAHTGEAVGTFLQQA